MLIAGVCALTMAVDVPLPVVVITIAALSLGYDMTQPLLGGIVTDLPGTVGQAVGLMAFVLFIGFGWGAWSSRSCWWQASLDLDDRVIDIQEHITLGVAEREQRGLPGQVAKEPGRDRVELADVTERERAQERSQGRGCVEGGEETAHAAVAQQRHVIDLCRRRHRSIYADDVIMPTRFDGDAPKFRLGRLFGGWPGHDGRHNYRASRKASSGSVGW